MSTVRGRGVKTFTIGTAVVRVAHINKLRASLTILAAAANTGTIYVGYDDQNVASSGNNLGIPLSSSDQITEQPPAVFQGEVYAIASGAGQVLQVVETDEIPDDRGRSP